ncbi:MAG: thioredoxin-related protein [Verrucomicrobiales bacterium]|jgi:thioredoxin-related protein
MIKRISILIAFVAVSIFGSSAQARTWTQAGSDKTIEGDFLRMEGELALIVRPNGTVIKAAASAFSEADQKFIVEAAAKAEAEAKQSAAAGNAVFKWEDDLEKAQERAKAEGKPIFLDFTGSDWCGYCIQLKEQIFDQREFKEFAKENLVLMEVDFPRRTSLSRSITKQNQELQGKYKVTGFPTVILLSPDGEILLRQSGFGGGTPKAYVEKLATAAK